MARAKKKPSMIASKQAKIPKICGERTNALENKNTDSTGDKTAINSKSVFNSDHQPYHATLLPNKVIS